MDHPPAPARAAEHKPNDHFACISDDEHNDSFTFDDDDPGSDYDVYAAIVDLDHFLARHLDDPARLVNYWSPCWWVHHLGPIVINHAATVGRHVLRRLLHGR